MDNGDVNDAKGGAEDATPVEDVVEDAKPVEDVVQDAKPVEDVVEDAKPVEDVVEDTKPVEDVVEDAKPVQDSKDDADDAKDDVQDEAKDAKHAEGNKKRKNSNESSAVEKKGKKTMRAWLIDGACASKQDITCFNLQMSDPFDQLKNNHFTPEITLQMVVVDYKQKGQKKKNMTFCFDEEGAYTCKQNVVMAGICREIWPDPESNPFSHGAFGSYVLYCSGSVSGAPCSYMLSVATINDVIERLRESNE